MTILRAEVEVVEIATAAPMEMEKDVAIQVAVEEELPPRAMPYHPQPQASRYLGQN